MRKYTQCTVSLHCNENPSRIRAKYVSKFWPEIYLALIRDNPSRDDEGTLRDATVSHAGLRSLMQDFDLACETVKMQQGLASETF